MKHKIQAHRNVLNLLLCSKVSICLFAAFLSLLITSGISAQTTAVSITPYAQVRIWAGYIQQSKEMSATGTYEGKTDTDFYSRMTSSRIGLSAKYDDLVGVFEIGLANKSSSSSNAVTTRKAYGEYLITSDIKLLFGQNEAPFTWYSNAEANDDLCQGYGATADGRELQLKLTAFNAYLDIINPNSPANPVSDTDGLDAQYWDIIIPKIAAGYDFISSDKNILVGCGGVAQQAQVDKEESTTGDPYTMDGEKLTCYLLYAHANASIAGLLLRGNFGYGQNTANLGLSYSNAQANAMTSANIENDQYVNPKVEFNATNDKFENTKSMEGYIEAGFDLGKFVPLAGVGYLQAKNSNWDKTDKQMTYYAQLKITIVETHLYFIPTLQYRDFMKDKDDAKQGNESLAGIFLHGIY